MALSKHERRTHMNLSATHLTQASPPLDVRVFHLHLSRDDSTNAINDLLHKLSISLSTPHQTIHSTDVLQGSLPFCNVHSPWVLRVQTFPTFPPLLKLPCITKLSNWSAQEHWNQLEVRPPFSFLLHGHQLHHGPLGCQKALRQYHHSYVALPDCCEDVRRESLANRQAVLQQVKKGIPKASMQLVAQGFHELFVSAAVAEKDLVLGLQCHMLAIIPTDTQLN